MNALTSKFLAYRKRAPVAAPVAAPAQQYPIEGFLSNDETTLQRMGRLVEAMAKGMSLSVENRRWRWRHMGCRKPFQFSAAHSSRLQKKKIHQLIGNIARETRNVFGGM